MGKIYKNITSPQINTTPYPSIPKSFTLPTPQVIPLDQFDYFLNLAQNLIEKNSHKVALPHLLNLEVTDFKNIRVHELLSDTFLKLNQITLAKEQLQIYAQLLKENFEEEFTENSTSSSGSVKSLTISNPALEGLALKSFDQLLEEAGDFNELVEEVQQLRAENITEINLHHGTKIILNLATHYIARKEYQEAETLLVNYRDHYLNFLNQEEL